MMRRFTPLQHARAARSGQQIVPLLVILAALLLGSCSAEDEAVVNLPVTPVIDLRPTWAVVTVPYLRLRALPDQTSEVTSHLRRGDVARVDAIDTAYAQVDGERARWYLLVADHVQGWAPDTVLNSFVSELRARNVARRLLEE